MRLMNLTTLDFEINVEDMDSFHECVFKSTAGGKRFTVVITTIPINRSRFGDCTCGITKTKTFPCKHMVAVVKSSVIDGLEQLNVMPYWCTTAAWRLQFPQNSSICVEINICSLEAKHEPSHELRYCPSIAGPKKPGRPKNMKCIKSALELGTGKKVKSKKGMEIHDDTISEAENENIMVAIGGVPI